MTNRKSAENRMITGFSTLCAIDNNYFTSDNVHYVKFANTYQRKNNFACIDNNMMIQYCQQQFC